MTWPEALPTLKGDGSVESLMAGYIMISAIAKAKAKIMG